MTKLVCPCGEIHEEGEDIECHLIEVHCVDGDFCDVLVKYLMRTQKKGGLK